MQLQGVVAKVVGNGVQSVAGGVEIGVVAFAAVQLVVAAQALQLVVACRSGNPVVAVGGRVGQRFDFGLV